MKHKIILSTVIILFGFQTFAQLKPFRFGVKAAPNVAWISADTEDYENDGAVLGFSWGFLADITLMEHYFLKTGFNFDYLNGKLILPFEDINDSIFGFLHRKYNLRYLEIPLTFKMRTNQFGKFAIYGHIGFGAGFRMRARSQDELYNENGGLLWNDDKDITDNLTLVRGSLIVGVGTEFFVDQSTSIILDFTFNNGLSNILKDDVKIKGVDKGYIHYFQLNIGVMF
jgi:hypothetical protein